MSGGKFEYAQDHFNTFYIIPFAEQLKRFEEHRLLDEDKVDRCIACIAPGAAGDDLLHSIYMLLGECNYGIGIVLDLISGVDIVSSVSVVVSNSHLSCFSECGTA